MQDKARDELEAMWETMAGESNGDVFESRRSLAIDIPKTLPRFGVSAVETLPRLTTEPDGDSAGQLNFVRLLRTGGMGEIHIARQGPIGRRVAVKRLRKDKRTERHRLSLLKEGWIAAHLQHPNIVPVYTLGKDEEEQPAIVMKLIEGVGLDEILADFDKLPQVFKAESQLESHIDILIQVCNAVSYTHDQGVIHRDIKPSNIMVGEYGEVYLLDWGIATQIAPGRTPVSDTEAPRRGAEGTPAYMAPEMAAPSFGELSRRTDVFLLGACLHEILTGEAINAGDSYFEVLRSAFEAEPPEYGFDVPEELARIATKALARDPKDRFRRVVDFRKALRDFLNFQTSWRLSEVARSKLVVLEEKIERSSWTSRNELYPLFGACRFGFQHALDVRGSNEKAREGLQRAVEAMIAWELDNGGATAAEVLSNALPEPNSELQARIDVAVEHHDRQQRESLYTQMSPDAVIAVDRHGTIVYANEQTSHIFGWSPDELVGESVECLVPESGRSAHVGFREAYSDDPKRRSMGSGLDLEGVRKDGVRVSVDISLAPVQTNGEQVTIASIRQKDPPIDAEDFLGEQTSLDLLDALQTPIFLVHADRVVWANTAFCRRLDHDSVRDLAGRPIDTLFPQDAPEFPTRAQVSTDGPIELENIEVLTANREPRKLDLRFTVGGGNDFAEVTLVEVL